MKKSLLLSLTLIFAMIIMSPAVSSAKSVRLNMAMANENKSCSLIDEDRVWRYMQSCNSNVKPNVNYIMSLCFDGTTTIDGVEYYNCKAWSGDILPMPDDSPVIAYMREINGKVFMRLPDGFDCKKLALDYNVGVLPSFNFGLSGIFDIITGSDKDEIMIYDFNLSKNDSFFIIPDNTSETNTVNVLEQTSFTHNNEPYVIQAYLYDFADYTAGDHDITCLNKTGSLRGLLPYPSNGSGLLSKTSHNLYQICDKKGNLLTDISDLWKSYKNHILSADRIKTGNIISTEYYDLYGRITSSDSNDIIIRIDKLSDGTIRSTKVINQAR